MTDSDISPLRIRALQPGEALRLYPVFHAAVHRLASRHYTPAQCEAWAPMPFDEAAWVQRIERNRPYVALMGGRIAGFADLQPDGTIDQFFVDAAHAGQGVGGALLAFVLDRARAGGLRQLRSHVSLSAQPLFARHGFAVEQRQTVQLRGMAFENAVMVCDLHP